MWELNCYKKRPQCWCWKSVEEDFSCFSMIQQTLNLKHTDPIKVTGTIRKSLTEKWSFSQVVAFWLADWGVARHIINMLAHLWSCQFQPKFWTGLTPTVISFLTWNRAGLERIDQDLVGVRSVPRLLHSDICGAISFFLCHSVLPKDIVELRKGRFLSHYFMASPGL